MKPSDDDTTLKAVALQWDGLSTPRVLAQGEGELAREIIAAAQAQGIPLQEEPELAALLSQLQLDQDIPETLFVAVAEAIAFAYYLSGRTSLMDSTEV